MSINAWYPNVFDFRQLEKQLPECDTHDNDDTLVQPDPTADPSIYRMPKSHDNLPLRRSSRKPEVKLRFEPGVNYVPRLYYYNNVEQMQDDSIEEQHNATIQQEHAFYKSDIDKIEHYINEVKQSVQDIENVPETVAQALSSSERDHWIPSIKAELKALRRNHTWDEVRTATKKHLIKTKWVFRKKIRADGTIRYKSRLVAKGYTQKYGDSFWDTYAPTVSLSAFRLVVALASRRRMKLHSIDIDNAYLQSQIDAEIHLQVPKGFSLDDEVENPDAVKSLKLKKGLYGLRQSGYLWSKTFRKSLDRWGFLRSKSDPCVYFKKIDGRLMIVTVFVDDCTIAHENKSDLQNFLKQVGSECGFKNEGPTTWTLGIQVGQETDGSYFIHQSRYIDKLVQKYNPKPDKRVRTPLSADNLYQEDSPPVDVSEYKSIIGALLYISIATRPDLAFACSRLGQFSTEPKEVHYKQALRCIQYLDNTKHYRIRYSADEGLKGWADAGFNTCKVSGKSQTGYVLNYAGAPVMWRSFKQTCVANSTGEAEHMALSPLCRETIFAKQLLGELFQKERIPVLVYDDSEPAIAIASNIGFSNKSRSIRISYHNVRDCVERNDVRLVKTPGSDNVADIFTKVLSRASHGRYCNRMFGKR